jgi:hypothetical protein
MAGYTTLGSMMGTHPEAAIVRRFGSLNVQNILYLQAELTTLELELKRCAKADADSGHQNRAVYDRDWRTLSESLQSQDGNPEQWKTILIIREKLKEYSEGLSYRCTTTIADAHVRRRSHPSAELHHEARVAESSRPPIPTNLDANTFHGKCLPSRP